MNSSLHIGEKATVTTYAGKEEGGVNIEVTSFSKNDINAAISYDGDISEALDYQTNTNGGDTYYNTVGNDIYAYHKISSDYLMTDSEDNLYLKYEDYGCLLLGKHNGHWYVSNAVTYTSSVEGLDAYTGEIPEDLSAGDGKIGVYEGLYSIGVNAGDSVIYSREGKVRFVYACICGPSAPAGSNTPPLGRTN